MNAKQRSKHYAVMRQKGRKLLREFEDTIELAEMRALSKRSLEASLTDAQAARYLALGRKRGLI